MVDKKHIDSYANQAVEPTVASPIEPVVMWISVDSELPEEPGRYNQKWVDVWVNGEREVDVSFFDGKFHLVVEDYQGDFDHQEEIKNVTHWMVVNSPSS